MHFNSITHNSVTPNSKLVKEKFNMKSLLSSKQKKVALKTFQGLKEAEKVITKERLHDLANLTIEEGLAHFNDLYHFYEMSHPSISRVIDELRIQDFWTLRRRLDLLGRKKDE